MEFPEIKGFSRRNVYAMVQWYKFYAAKYPFVPQHVAQIPWGHNRLIISKTSSLDEAEYYCRKTIENNWDRDTLELQIKAGLFKTQFLPFGNRHPTAKRWRQSDHWYHLM